jgi:hypothetical protein
MGHRGSRWKGEGRPAAADDARRNAVADLDGGGLHRRQQEAVGPRRRGDLQAAGVVELANRKGVVAAALVIADVRAAQGAVGPREAHAGEGLDLDGGLRRSGERCGRDRGARRSGHGPGAGVAHPRGAVGAPDRDQGGDAQGENGDGRAAEDPPPRRPAQAIVDGHGD